MVSAGGRGNRSGPPPATIVVKTKDGRESRGVRRNEDTFSLQMIDVSGGLHLLDKRTLASVAVENRSLHPTDYATRLSRADLANLVAYLTTLRGRDMAKTASAPVVPGGVTYERLLRARSEPHNWLMYGTSGGSPRTVTAMDARTGRQIWRFVRPQKVRNPGETDVVNRGIAIL